MRSTKPRVKTNKNKNGNGPETNLPSTTILYFIINIGIYIIQTKHLSVYFCFFVAFLLLVPCASSFKKYFISSWDLYSLLQLYIYPPRRRHHSIIWKSCSEIRLLLVPTCTLLCRPAARLNGRSACWGPVAETRTTINLDPSPSLNWNATLSPCAELRSPLAFILTTRALSSPLLLLSYWAVVLLIFRRW